MLCANKKIINVMAMMETEVTNSINVDGGLSESIGRRGAVISNSFVVRSCAVLDSIMRRYPHDRQAVSCYGITRST